MDAKCESEFVGKRLGRRLENLKRSQTLANIFPTNLTAYRLAD